MSRGTIRHDQGCGVIRATYHTETRRSGKADLLADVYIAPRTTHASSLYPRANGPIRADKRTAGCGADLLVLGPVAHEDLPALVADIESCARYAENS